MKVLTHLVKGVPISFNYANMPSGCGQNGELQADWSRVTWNLQVIFDKDKQECSASLHQSDISQLHTVQIYQYTGMYQWCNKR